MQNFIIYSKIPQATSQEKQNDLILLDNSLVLLLNLKTFKKTFQSTVAKKLGMSQVSLKNALLESWTSTYKFKAEIEVDYTQTTVYIS